MAYPKGFCNNKYNEPRNPSPKTRCAGVGLRDIKGAFVPRYRELRVTRSSAMQYVYEQGERRAWLYYFTRHSESGQHDYEFRRRTGANLKNH